MKTRPTSICGVLGLLMALLLPGRVAAQTNAQLYGEVFTKGAGQEEIYLPGATLTLVSKADPSHRFRGTTDARGTFTLFDIPPGYYTLTVTLTGYETLTQDVGLEAGAVQKLRLEMRLQTVKEEVTVTAEAQGIQPQQTTTSTEIKGSTYETAPLLSERFLDALPLVPGVVRGPDGLIKIKGAPSTETGWLVNSANVTDPVTGEQAINLPVDVIQDVEVLANPFSAAYGKFTGAVTTIETRPAADKWHFQLHNFVPRLRRREGHIMGFESVSPRITVSGPLGKKVSVLQSLEYRLSQNPVTSLPASQQDSQIESLDSFTQLDFDLTPLNKLSAVFSLYPEKNRYANLDTFNPRPVTANYHQRGWMTGLRDRALFNNGSFLESTVSVKRFDVDVYPDTVGGGIYTFTPERVFGSFHNVQNRASRRYEVVESYSFAPLQAAGQHWFKVGFNFSRDLFHGLSLSQPVEIRREDGTLAERIDFLGDPLLDRDKSETTFFLQDKWNVNPRLTLDLGARYDYDTVAKRHNLAPRFGFAYVLTADTKTLLRGGIGLFYDKVPLNVAVFPQMQQRQVTLFDAAGLPLGPPLTYVNLLDNVENPRGLAYNLQLERELAKGLLLRFGYLQRESRHEYIVEPLDSLGGIPTLLAGAAGSSRYREFELTANYQFHEGDFLNLSYVRSHSTGDLNTFQTYFGNIENPIIRPNQNSLLKFDVPDRFVAWGDVTWLWKLHWAPILEVRNGFPFSLIDENQDFVGVRNRGERFPVFSTLDLRIYRRFEVKAFSKTRGLTLGVTFFNLFSHFNPRDIQQNIDAIDALGLYNGRGRLLRGKFSIDF